MVRNLMLFLAICLLVAADVSSLAAQTATERKLYQALQQSEADLDQCRNLADSLRTALSETQHLWNQRKVYTDSLILNLKAQIGIQGSIDSLLQTNADSLDAMVQDYAKKLDEVSTLYIEQLRQQGKPWYFTWHGWKGFFSGVVIGGAVGLIYAIAG